MKAKIILSLNHWAISTKDALRGILGAMAVEHAGYYARYGEEGVGFTGSLTEGAWRTSGGNILRCREENGDLHIEVSGRRHGIPWRFLSAGLNGGEVQRVQVLDYETQRPDLAPWETTDGIAMQNEWLSSRLSAAYKR